MLIHNDKLFQYATVKISCNEEVGTALLYSPGDSLDYIYILTVKHCLTGKYFDGEFRSIDIKIENIFNPVTGEFHSCNLEETDIVICTESNELDLALIIMPKHKLEALSGINYFFQITDKPGITGECFIRGFADFNSGEVDRPYNLKFSEYVKDKPKIISLNFDGKLDTRYQSAIENVQGLSGSGVFAVINGNLFLMGLAHAYEEKNRFFATLISTYNYLIPSGYEKFIAVDQEEDQSVIDTFSAIEVNKSSIKARARDTVGGIHIEREISEAKKMLEKNRMLVFHGKAGTGKSALAKKLIMDYEKSPETSVITFNSEQLFSPTLNEALIKAGYTSTVNKVIESPLSKKRIFFWVESFEKLAEAGFGGAFTELLLLVKTNPRLSLIVTIRDYFLQKFKIFYHSELVSLEVFLYVDEFSDSEMKEIMMQIPEMEPLFSNPKLVHLLKTPFYLDKAFRIYPQLLRVENLDELHFKKLMWEEIVEAGNRQRGAVFRKIALQRAMSMELYTYYEADAVTDSLVGDNILQVEQGELSNRFSPSHDILEDWALIRYIKQKKQDSASSHDFIKNLDEGPAVRRAFRLWLEEFYKTDYADAENFCSELMLNPAVEASWKDELLVYILRSNNAYFLFTSLREHLIENEGVLLLRVIHLLRTCCKELKGTTNDFNDLVPVGSGWDALIDFVQENRSLTLDIPDIEDQMLDVIFDWSRQLPDFNSKILPASSKNAAMFLLDYTIKNQSNFTGYRRNFNLSNHLNQSLKLILKLTHVIQLEIKNLLDAVLDLPLLNNDIWNNKNVLVYVRNFIVDGITGEQLCKYFPDEVMKMASDRWLEEPKLYSKNSLMGQIVPVYESNYWGLKDIFEYESASAFQTFFYWMFLYHPEKAVAYICEFLNTAFDQNQKHAGAKGRSSDVALDYEDFGRKLYYGSYEYWVLYRGHSAYNQIIQSLLMALEKGLLDSSEKREQSTIKLQELLAALMIKSNNAAVLGVVASVVQAYPYLLDETTIVLLGSKTILNWDSTRYTRDLMSDHYYGTNPFLRKERNQSQKLKHRTAHFRGLIGFTSHYMFSYQTMNNELFKLIDKMWADSSETDHFWRKALSEMDLRKYTFEPVAIDGYNNHFVLSPGYEQGVSEVINSFKNEKLPRAGVVWASEVFDGKTVEDNSYEVWKSGYEDLQNSDIEFSFMMSPGKMACLGLRDYFEMLQESEKFWCRDEILKNARSYLEKPSGYSGDMTDAFLDRNAVLFGVPLLFKLPAEAINETKLRDLVFRLVIAPLERDKKKFLQYSIVENLLKNRLGFAKNCWNGLLAYIQYKTIENRRRKNDRLSGIYSCNHASEVAAEKEFIDDLTAEIILDTPFQSNCEFAIDHTTCWFLDDALLMIATSTEDNVEKSFIDSFLKMHLDYLSSLKAHDHNEFFQSLHVLKSFYAKYLLNRSNSEAEKLFTDLLNLSLENDNQKNLIETVSFVNDLLKQIIAEVDGWQPASQPITEFWFLWQVLKDWILSTKRAFFIPVLLLDIRWKDTADNWRVLEKKSFFYRDFIPEYGHNAINQCIDLVSGIGFKNFMPHSVLWLADLLKYLTVHIIKSDKLERYVDRSFFNYGAKIKSSKELTGAFVFILDFLIERGSPKAYMLKEEMIQYK